MAEKKDQKDKARPKVEMDLGFGGLFKGLGEFIDLISVMTEKGPSETTHQGEFSVKGLGERGKGIYGFTVRTDIAGMPRVERFGNIQTSERGPVVAEVRDPLVDVFEERDEVVIVGELPGVQEAEIDIDVKDDIVQLETSGGRKYAKEILLPAKVDAASMKKTYNNGILELRLKKA